MAERGTSLTRPVIAARGLRRAYQSGEARVEALRGVDLAIEPGEFVAVMGPSGCGKSTLLHLLGGLDRPTTGEIELDGVRVEHLSEARWATLRRKQVGFIFQFFHLIANLSVADNVELPALLAGVAPAEARRRRVALLAQLGLADKGGVAPAQLSGGQQQRVAIARALINQPTLLLADEPTGNLDPVNADRILALLRECVRAEGATCLLVTHSHHAAARADRSVTLTGTGLRAVAVASAPR